MKAKRKQDKMNNWHFLWIIPVAALFSPVGAIVMHVITGSPFSWLLVLGGVCAVAASVAGHDGYD